MSHKVGYVSIIGLPNVGKSTLLNAILKQKISIVTPKPQTTRKKILGILTENNYQIIFLDTPGIVRPAYLLHEKMLEEINESIKDADVLVLLFDVSNESRIKESEENEIIKNLIEQKTKPIILALNKVDSITQEQAQQLVNHYESFNNFKAVVPIAASSNFNVERLIQEIVSLLSEGEKFYPDDIISEASERFFVSEIIREKIFELYEDEIPYSTEVIIVEFKERTTGKDFISAEIIVERDSQKPIIIGKEGKAIKKLGEVARKTIEEFLRKEVYLELRVKVREKWRSNEKMLKYFGYGVKK
ncbi:GTP-binding protein Era [Ignavibacterium album JCM 16511]|uniref:GTPase Era n=1 Tax=Ignavibacterium album (strain DSM 19864 / JCM 16511 / NBRC 101810 / Mat9-16) TaxID=945713 RepID=I0ALW1_IGNAJ|nr:GTPase Era [Ignavibacterium album]AFH49968.1 GTP-binding protein Era [Ignavibacterium album JCM 16511]